jgi:hypothetical protein
MKIVSHRGNIEGPDSNLENCPDQIRRAMNLGFDVEVDVWRAGSSWMLGHDNPSYSVEEDFFTTGMWVHCKNFEAISEMKKKSRNFEFFWHENDRMTLTSGLIPWCYSGQYIEGGITVHLSGPALVPLKSLGICTDFPKEWSLK